MTHTLHLSFCIVLCLSVPLGAQEICDNGLDDDGDGLVDLLDVADCVCSIAPNVPSIFPNPSFEDFAPDEQGCSSSQAGGLPDGQGQVDCLVGWIRASLGTTDSWNAFTYSGNAPFWPATLPLPLPSGSGVAGFWAGVMSAQDYDADGNQIGFSREYLGACLKDGGGLIPGEEYRLNLNIGYAEESFFSTVEEPVAPQDSGRISSPPDAPLALYGIRVCDEIRFEGNDCVENSPDAIGWEKITDFTVTGSPGTWTAASIDFVAAQAYEAIAIGANCNDNPFEARPAWRHYYFIDDIRINTVDAFTNAGFTPGPVSVQGESICDENILLIGSEADEASYQWYKNGIAIGGATNLTYRVMPGLDVDGSYQLRTTVPQGCAVSDPVTIQRPVIPSNLFRDSFALCPNGVPVTIRPISQFAANYEWGDGSTGQTLDVDQPGEYSVTISTACERTVENYAVIQNGEPFFTVDVAGQDCFDPTQPTTFTIVTDWELGFILAYTVFVNGGEQILAAFDPTSFTLQTLPSPIIRFQAATSCGPTIDFLVDLRTLEPQFTASLPNLNCRSGGGTIELTPQFTDSLTYRWLGPTGDTIAGASELSLDVTEPGTYTLLTLSEDGCDNAIPFTVSGSEQNIDFEATVPTLTCELTSGELSVTTDDTARVTYSWVGPDGAPITGATGPSITVDEAGTYLLQASYGEVCEQTQSFTVSFIETPVDFTAAIPEISCLQPAGDLVVTTTYSGPLTYQWVDGAGEPIPGATSLRLPITGSGSFTLTYLFPGGCAGSEEFEVPFQNRTLMFQPQIPTLTCDNPRDRITVETDELPGVTYQWFGPDGLLIPGATDKSITIQEPGQYRLEALLPSGCTEIETAIVPFENTLSATVDVASSDCEDLHSLAPRFSAADPGAYRYSWSDSLGNIISRAETLSDAPSGSYFLFISNGEGCETEVSIEVDTVIGLRLDSVRPIVVCDEPGATLATSVSGGTGPFTYGLLGEAGGLDADVLVPEVGNYIVEVTDVNGCRVIGDPVLVRRPVEFEIDIGDNKLVKLGEPVILRTLIAPPADRIPGLSLSWQSTGDSLSCDNCLDPFALPTSSTTYTLVATSAEGCVRSASVTLDVDTRAPAFFPTAFSPNADGVNDIYEIFPGAGYAGVDYLRIYNRWGALCYKAGPDSPGWDGRIGGEPAAIGAYTVIARLLRLDGRLITVETTMMLLR